MLEAKLNIGEKLQLLQNIQLKVHKEEDIFLELKMFLGVR
jgi:hypothetical protein